jgi:uncharacterized metal-binding protein
MAKKDDKQWNFSNVVINMMCLPVVIPIILQIGNRHLGRFGNGGTQSVFEYVAVATLTYMWCSRFFQPDLDHDDNRPGKGSFPIGVTPTNALYKFLNTLLSPILGKHYGQKLSHGLTFGPSYLMAKIWNTFWMPYAFILTHRGLSHWPIIGTLTRIWYLYGATYVVMKTLGLPVTELKLMVEGFYFWKGINVYTLYLATPIYLCDLFHSMGDFIESRIKGFSFCPPKVRRGPIAKILRMPI